MRFSRSSSATTALLPFLLPPFASALSLGDFQVLPSTVTSTNCAATYNAPISSCSTDDFSTGAQCSQPCIVALLLKASDIQKACVGAVTGDGTLLAYAFHNQLAATVCSNVVGDGAGSSQTTGSAGSSPSTTASSSSSSPSSSSSSSAFTSPSSTASSSSSSSSSSSASPTTTSSSSSATITHDTAFSPTSGSSGFRTTALISTDGASSTPLPTRNSYSQNGGSPFQQSNDASTSLRAPLLIFASVFSTITLTLLLR